MRANKEARSRAMRYKRPALASLGAEFLIQELEEIAEACDGIKYYVDQDDDETLLNALNGDEEAEWEFKVAFSDLSAKCEELQTALWEQQFEDFYRDFDDCTVALQDIVHPITNEVLRRKGDIEIGSDWYNADTEQFSSIGVGNPFWRVLAWAETPKPPVPEEIRPRVRRYFGKQVEAGNG